MHQQPKICGIVLAAGRSQRFGQDNKLLEPLSNGLPLIIQAVRNMRSAIENIIVILPQNSEALTQSLKDEDVQIAINPEADVGMGNSLACGISASGEANGWIIGLADMPWIQAATISRIKTSLQNGQSLVAPRYRTVRGHPVGFGQKYRDTLLKLDGDAGARTVLKQHRADLHYLEVDDPGILLDVDTPADLKHQVMFNF
jgi:molybdenum cofactor cytidylyltransferase